MATLRKRIRDLEVKALEREVENRECFTTFTFVGGEDDDEQNRLHDFAFGDDERRIPRGEIPPGARVIEFRVVYPCPCLRCEEPCSGGCERYNAWKRATADLGGPKLFDPGPRNPSISDMG